MKILVGVILLALSFAGLCQQPTVEVGKGWNLVGNSTTAPIEVATFGDKKQVFSVWKWHKTKKLWYFYTPLFLDGGAAFAMSNGYEHLKTVGAGEGFWVNAREAFTFELPSSTPIDTATVRSRLVGGWNLVATGENQTPREFNEALSVTPPSPGVIPTDNIVSLWKWDNPQARWKVYAPTLDANGTLQWLIANAGYLDFGTDTLAPGTGFWVNSLIDGNGKVYVTYTGFYPFVVTKTGVTKVKNMTEFQIGWSALGNCKLYEVLVNGIIPVRCQVAVDGIERRFYIDPTTDEIRSYTGNDALDDAKFHMVPWGTAMPYAVHDIGTLGSYVEVADGVFSIQWSNSAMLRFSDYDFTTTTVVATGDPGGIGTFGVIIKYPLTP